MGSDYRPVNCRFRLQDEGKAYPRSSCAACGRGITTGLGKACHKAVNETEIDRLRTTLAVVEAERDALIDRLSSARVREEANQVAYENVTEKLRKALAGRGGRVG